MTAALFVCLHEGQIEAGCNARIYALAALLAAVTSWLLLKALNDERQRRHWWAWYGMSAAALMYTHPYSWYTLAAQSLFTAGSLMHLARVDALGARTRMAGAMFASAIAFALFSPWVPAFYQQVHRVRHGFTSVTISDRIPHEFLVWLTGADHPPHGTAPLAAALLLGGIAWGMARHLRTTTFLLVQAALPWVLTWFAEVSAGMTIFQPRYMVMAQLHIIALVGFIGAQLPRRIFRLIWAVFWVGLWLHGSLLFLRLAPAQPPAIGAQAEYLREHYRHGDSLYVASAADLNLIRYYAHQLDLDEIDVRCPVAAFAPKGQPMHVASLHADDVWPTDYVPPSVMRLWTAGQMVPPREGWRRVLSRTFPDGYPANGGSYFLNLYVREQ